MLLERARRIPPSGEATELLGLLQFFVGGFVLFVATVGVQLALSSFYDDFAAVIGWGINAVLIAMISMICAWILGLPLRHIPRLRSWWLSNGEWPVAGVVLGFVALCFVVSLAPVTQATDEFGTYEARMVDPRALLAVWGIFAFSVVHFVWPLRWTDRE
ncbi:hypothetical protein ARHIZOSPH14_25460 [Agromyces rhizosphaerae]|uniref:Uncharacterized protein n=1 Tax=Agromyces rhizosphaerae TaxID=88374 RepID=A0A9W6FPR3_9MICO|nr:hypothetical protein [Agromyces rhizosphaerae]GLI28304.1 hypothetical protein ARHIZOSPH14_25460 [Agromyces rhizosphaerae]